VKGKKAGARLVLLAVLAALATFLVGGGPAGAVAVHPLQVTASTSIDRVCSWTIDKTGPTHLTLAVNETFDVPYDVTVTKTCHDTNRVQGTVDGPGNPASVAVTVGGTAASVSCTYNAISDTFHCTYEGDPPTTADGLVNAVATYTGGGTADNSPGTPYSFAGAPVKVSEESVDVFDSYAGTLAVHLDHSATFHYTRSISFDHCGDHFVIENTARVVDGTELGRVTHTLVVDVPCGHGCTLTQGYWKTHSKYGPAAKPDPAWNLLPGGLGPDTKFFLSGKTWYQVFWTPPSGGNVYYQLAHQYMAARLNILNGASSTAAVDAAIAWATTFFNTYTPSSSLSASVKSAAQSAAGTLGSYNEGAIGPGHCSE
jgi:hypothetical protein